MPACERHADGARGLFAASSAEPDGRLRVEPWPATPVDMGAADLALSISSSTKNQLPSAITKPSRSRESGRDARSGSWFQWVDMMRIN